MRSGKQNSKIKDDWDNGYNIEVIGSINIVAKDVNLKLIAKPLRF
jgi:hypothetical protein